MSEDFNSVFLKALSLLVNKASSRWCASQHVETIFFDFFASSSAFFALGYVFFLNNGIIK